MFCVMLNRVNVLWILWTCIFVFSETSSNQDSFDDIIDREQVASYSRIRQLSRRACSLCKQILRIDLNL